MSITVVSTWDNYIVSPSTVVPPPNPAAQSCQVPIANSGLNQNWLFAVCSWITPNPYQTTVAVGDDTGNYWEPLGAPSGTSPAGGTTRTSIWYCRNARVAGNVFVSPNGFALAIQCLVLEVSGLSPWANLTGITSAYANAATALGTLSLGVPPASVPLNQNTLTGQSISPWTGEHNAQVASSNAWGVGCDWSMMITPDGVTSSPGTVSEATIPVTASDLYSAQATVVCPSGYTPNCLLIINWMNASGGTISSTSGTGQPLPAAQAVTLSASGTAPGGAVAARVQFDMTGTPPATALVFASNATFGVPGQALLFTAATSDSTSGGVSGPGSGWTALPTIATGEYSTDLLTYSAWQVTTGAVTATWTATGGAADLSGVLGGVLVTGLAPAAASPTWPLIQAQAAFGAGASTPWDQLTWTGMTTRFQALSVSRGKQYELDSIQSGTGNWTWRNNDGALMPQFAGSVYSPFVQAYTPARLLVTWPPPPNANSRTYSVNRSFMERWPTKLTTARYQQSNAVSTDVWALTTALLRTIARAEILQDQPFGYWPLDDPAGAAYGSNLAPGNTNVLQVVQSKYGPGSGLYQFGVDASALVGDPSATSWEQTGVATTTTGYCLYYSDANLPAVASGSDPPGVSVSGWFNVLPVTGQPGGNLAVMTLKTSEQMIAQVYIPQSGADAGQLWLAAGPSYTHVLAAGAFATSEWFHVAVTMPSAQEAYFYVNGVEVFYISDLGFLDSPYWIEWCGTADRIGTGQMWNGQVAHAAVFPGALPAARVASQYLAMFIALYGCDTTGQRMERLLLAGNAAFPRIVPPGTNTVVGATDISGNACGQNIVNIAESDNTVLSVNGAGYLYSLARLNGYNLPVSWYFGEDPAVPVNSNPYMLAGIGSWHLYGGTAAWSSGWAVPWLPFAQKSLLFTPNGTEAGQGIFSGSNVNTADFPVTAGTSYTVSAWFMAPSGLAGGDGVYVAVTWYNGSGGIIGSATTSATAVLTPGVPAQCSCTAQAPAGAAYGQMSAIAGGTQTSANPFYVAASLTAATYTEQPYLPDFASDFDPAQVFNDVTLEQLATPSYLSYAFSAVTSGSMFTAGGSAFVAGQQIILTAPITGSLPGGFVANVPYYVIAVSGQSFQLSATSGGAAITVTSAGSGTVSGVTAATGVTIAIQSAASILQYGDQTVQETVYLTDPNVLTDLAWSIINTLGTPDVYITTMTLDPSANPALWPVVLSLESGQVAWVNRRLGGTEPEIAGLFQVMTVAHAAGPRSWKTSLSLLPYYGDVLTCDSPALGVLYDNPLGW